VSNTEITIKRLNNTKNFFFIFYSPYGLYVVLQRTNFLSIALLSLL